MDIKTKLVQSFEQALKNAVIKEELPELVNIPVLLEKPPQKSMGDYACNFAMQAAKQAKKSPRAVAQIIIDNFTDEIIDKLEIAGPGFLNFYLKAGWQTIVINNILHKGENYGNSNFGNNKKVLLEFVSANPTGPLHVGHGRGAAYGSALGNLFVAAGFLLTREHYINDTGNQINNLALSINSRYLELLGRQNEFPADGYHGQDIIETAKNIIDKVGGEYLELTETDRIKVLGEIALQEKKQLLKTDLAAFGVIFDSWFSEKSLHDNNSVIDTCEWLKQTGLTYEKDGALWLNTTNYGDDKDRVLIRENGLPTYFAADLAYHKEKIGRGYDLLINIWGADHHGYVGRMKAGITAMTGKPDILEIILLQMVHLYRQGELVKISKRTGQGITLRELIDEVGCDAARYFFIMRSPDSQLDFDLDLAVSRSNENPVYYIQYAHARIASIGRVLKEEGIEKMPATEVDFSLLIEECETEIISKLETYPEEIIWAAKERAPHRVATYAHELAGLFHAFYNQHRILGVDSNLQQARWYMAIIVGQVLRHALTIIGVSAPEKM